MKDRTTQLVLLVFTLTAVGCGSKISAMQIHTGGQTGCRPEEVRMGTVRSNFNAAAAFLDASTANQLALWWQADCRGKRYNCTGQQDRYAVRDVVCKPVQQQSVVQRPHERVLPYEEGVRIKCVAPEGNEKTCAPEDERLIAVLSANAARVRVHIVLWGHPARDPENEVAIYRHAPGPLYRSCRNVELSVNGEKDPMLAAKYTNGRGWEGLKVNMPLTTVERIATARSVRVRACADDITIPPYQLGILTDYVKQWQQMANAAVRAASMPPPTEAETDDSPPASAMSGCDYDTQCKGDRLCVNRQCVSPTSPQ